MIAFIYDECYTWLNRTISTWSWPASWRRRTWTAWWTRSGGPTCSTGGSESPPCWTKHGRKLRQRPSENPWSLQSWKLEKKMCENAQNSGIFPFLGGVGIFHLDFLSPNLTKWRFFCALWKENFRKFSYFIQLLSKFDLLFTPESFKVYFIQNTAFWGESL